MGPHGRKRRNIEYFFAENCLDQAFLNRSWITFNVADLIYTLQESKPTPMKIFYWKLESNAIL